MQQTKGLIQALQMLTLLRKKKKKIVTPEEKKKGFCDCSEKAPCQELLPLLRIQSMQLMHMALLPTSLIRDFGTAGVPRSVYWTQVWPKHTVMFLLN